MQFHPTYAYEDFVEGIRPVLRARATEIDLEDEEEEVEGPSDLGYVLRPGVLRDVVTDAEARKDEPVFLVIDEINRANLPRVLGELLFSLEYRGPGNEVVLPYSGDLFTLPENLWIIGTMNTADRSVALMDAAMRRRFKQVRFDVDYVALSKWHAERTTADLGGEAAYRLNGLNDALVDLLDEDRLLGHSYLMRRDLLAVGWETIWSEDFEPVLRDHLLGQLDELPALRKAFVDGPGS
jgi:5-methylcytosine-specific restriction protein B